MRVTKEQNITKEMTLAFKLEDNKIKDDANNETKLALMKLEKENMDAQMLRHEAMQLAKKCYASKHVEKTTLTNIGKDDASSAILAGVLTKLDVTKAAIGSE